MISTCIRDSVHYNCHFVLIQVLSLKTLKVRHIVLLFTISCMCNIHITTVCNILLTIIFGIICAIALYYNYHIYYIIFFYFSVMLDTSIYLDRWVIIYLNFSEIVISNNNNFTSCSYYKKNIYTCWTKNMHVRVIEAEGKK